MAHSRLTHYFRVDKLNKDPFSLLFRQVICNCMIPPRTPCLAFSTSWPHNLQLRRYTEYSCPASITKETLPGLFTVSSESVKPLGEKPCNLLVPFHIWMLITV